MFLKPSLKIKSFIFSFFQPTTIPISFEPASWRFVIIFHKNGFKNITFIEQSEPKGTAHAVSLAKDFVGGENFLVVMGDNLYSPADLKEILNSGGNCIAATKHESP